MSMIEPAVPHPTVKSRGDLLSDGYHKFDAEKKDNGGDGAESCVATLTATSGETPVSYTGKTGKDHGHAEIDALFQFLNAIGWSLEIFAKYTLTIQCLSKPCCIRCSAVMGHLSIVATDGTYKSKNTMGSTGYGLPPKVREFLVKKLKVTDQRIRMQICGDTI